MSNWQAQPDIDGTIGFPYFVHMKNVTVTLPEDVAHWVRVRAAQNDYSVSRWLADMLEKMRSQEDEYMIAMERFLARKTRELRWIDHQKPTREELHDRTGLR